MGNAKRGIVPGLIPVALIMILSACEAGKGPVGFGLVSVNNVEAKDSIINIYASRALEPAVYVLTDPDRMVVEIKDASLAKEAVKSGTGSGEMIRSWSLTQLELNQESSDGESVESVRLVLDLAKNATYKLQSESFGCSLRLEEMPKEDAASKPQKMEMSKELYNQVYAANTGQGSAEAASERAAARKMLDEIASVSVGSVPSNLQTPQSYYRQVQPQMSGSALPKAKVVTDVSFGARNGEFEVNVLGDGSLTSYKFFKLDSPYRAVVDIFGVRPVKAIKEHILVNNGQVREIRVGAHSGYLRVVVESRTNFQDVRTTTTGNKLSIKVIF